LDAKRIASALLMSPAAMGERIVRAKEMIRHHRLALMFACAHPAVEAGIRAPLILQVVRAIFRVHSDAHGRR
jgi:RNA polymerase sigma-70 factor (ECF subfamily)